MIGNNRIDIRYASFAGMAPELEACQSNSRLGKTHMVYSFNSAAEYLRFVGDRESERATIESYLSGLRKIPGYCPACHAVREFRHVAPAQGWSDLRENLACPCGLNGRMRMLFEILRGELRRLSAGGKVLMFEQVTPLFTRLKQEFPFVEGSEFVAPSALAGSWHETRGGKVRHEDICATSVAAGSLDLVFHGDVLEHVPDWRAALRENARILKPGGTLLFSAPAFHIPTHLIRAEARTEGIRHIQPPAFHGNPMSSEGSLVFTEFSVNLVDELGEYGFRDARIQLVYDAFKGIVSNNNPYEIGRMWPICFTAQKA